MLQIGLIKTMNKLQDENAQDRKKDHIALAFEAQLSNAQNDPRFSYEPLLSAHPDDGNFCAQTFVGKTLHTPIWVSSMTGGTQWAKVINENLARVCKDFGMGMGLGVLPLSLIL